MRVFKIVLGVIQVFSMYYNKKFQLITNFILVKLIKEHKNRRLKHVLNC